MTFGSGARLGPYEILSPLGAGGMGEVYKARDTRLERIVAIKVLPSHLSSSPEVRQRFEREAKTISALSHPHICALYDVGNQDGVEYLVMEYLEGETLADRLAKAPLALEQTLRYGIEIADALDRAHRQGIVHRDLKPGNVMLTKSGVKLLDFGLAKAMAPMSAQSSVTALPTMAGSTPLTQEGTILGTFQYMAPEQLEGSEADARTDIFAFGAVLYEMASGRKAFTGKSQASLISSIMSLDPQPISSVQPMSPPALDRVVKTCLAKDPDERWQSAHDVASELKWIAQGDSPIGLPPAAIARRTRRERFALSLAAFAFLAALAGIGAAIYFGQGARLASRLVRASVLPPESWSFGPSIALSPDGRELAFVATSTDRKATLWVRPIDSLTARPLPDTEGASYPFWSPDSRFLGFFAKGKLKKIEASGGPSQTICDAPIGRGGSWSPDGVIIFAPRNRAPIHRVSASGGSATPVTQFEGKEGSHRWPWFLPDGRHFLFLVLGGGEGGGRIFVGSLDSKEKQRVLDFGGAPGSNAVYAAPGYLLYVRESNLLARPFDASRLTTRGEPVLVGDQALYTPGVVHADFSASQQGVIAYRKSTAASSRLLWIDRNGKEIGSIGEPGYYRSPRVSPDGRKISVILLDPRSQAGDIWIYGAERESATRFTFQPGVYRGNAWAPDGQRLAFAFLRSLELKSNGGNEEKLVDSGSLQTVSDWSSDGRYLLYSEITVESGADLLSLPLSGDRKPVTLLATPFNEGGGHFSFDGKWVAYVSDESGRDEVYVRPFLRPGAAVRISTGGGRSPRWRRDGKEIYYMADDRNLMAVELKEGAEIEIGQIRPLFQARITADPSPFEADYDVATDGQRFLINTPVGETPTPTVNLVLNWDAGLKR